MSADSKEVSQARLRSPGDPEPSGDVDARPILMEHYAQCFLGTPILCAYALMEWLRWYRSLPPPPWSATIMASVALIYTIFKVVTTWRAHKSLR